MSGSASRTGRHRAIEGPATNLLDAIAWAVVSIEFHLRAIERQWVLRGLGSARADVVVSLLLATITNRLVGRWTFVAARRD
jgi:hypothetical protein